MDIIQNGVEQGYISLNNDCSRITYIYQNKSRNFNNPEEKVQALTFLKLIFQFGYSEKRIHQFVPVTMGSETKEADIVVYDDDECTKPIIIVECKKQDVSELEFQQAIEQAASYAYALAGTVKCIWVTSKIKDATFLIDKERQTKTSIPSIPPFGREIPKYKYAKGGLLSGEVAGNNPVKQKFFDLEVIAESELTNRFKQAHQSLWAGGELNPSSAFDELDKLIFCKIWDERKNRKKGVPYDFQIIDIETPKNANKDQIAELEYKKTDELYKRILALYEEGRAKDKEVFRDNIRLSPEKVRMVVSYLQGVNLSKTDLDSKGKAFETFMGSYFRGDFGQYFTPRPIVKFIVNCLPITENSKVLDTSCGSGGFLLYALDKVRSQADEIYPDHENDMDEHDRHYKYWHDFASNNLFGIEINEQIARTAKMNMIIHDDGHTNVISGDGLMPWNDLIINSENKGFRENSFDFVITNPPFGSAVKQTEKAYLHQYNLGNKDVGWLDTKKSAVQKRDSQNTEVLFIEQDWNFLKEGGFLAIVIPDGVLTNSTMQYVRDNIEQWFRIVAVISMPQIAFSATGAGVKSSVLFLRKWSAEKTARIDSKKKSIQKRLREHENYKETVEKIESDKKDVIKNHTGFIYNGTETEKKKIERTAEFAEWKKQVSDEASGKIDALKEKLEELYLEAKKNELEDYDIFMAIAEDIGYDATGKETGNNELDVIGKELEKFIAHIIQSESF